MSEPASLFDRLLDDVIDASRLGCSVLVHAAVQGHVEVLTSILQRISNNNQHRTPCHEQPSLSEALTAAFLGAARRGHSTCLAAMLESGCHLYELTTTTQGGNTALLLGADSKGATALIAAAGNGHAECLQQLLQHNPVAQVAATNNEGWNALRAAAMNGHVECVQQLLQYDPVAQVAAADNKGWTALMVAASAGHAECLQQLLQHSPEAQVAVTNNEGWTALRAAALHGHVECVQQLLQYGPVAQVAAADNGRWTSLMAAAWNGHVECVQQLLQHNPAAQVAAGGSTAFLLATMNNHPDCVALLLPHSPSGLSAALHIAAAHGFPQCLDLLLTMDHQQQQLDAAWLSALREWNATDARTSPRTQCLERLMAKGAAIPIQPAAADHAKNRLFLQALASRALVADRTNAAVVELAQSVSSRKRKAVQER